MQLRSDDKADRLPRVVVTGMGAVSPLGLSVDEFWTNCVKGLSGIDYIRQCDPDRIPVKIAGEVRGFEPGKYMSQKEARRIGRFCQLAMAAALQALDHAGMNLNDRVDDRLGLIVGNAMADLSSATDQIRQFDEKGWKWCDPLAAYRMFPYFVANSLSMMLGIHGPTSASVMACSAGVQAIGEAVGLIRSGRADVVLCGGTEAWITPLALSNFFLSGAMSRKSEPPQAVSRPFDSSRDGFVAAEGAAILVLEKLDHALARDASIHAEVAGYASTSDGYHPFVPRQDGKHLARCISLALADAGVEPTEIDYINAHGTSTKLSDVAETRAVKLAFGEHAYRVPISATKSMIGHAVAAAGALESVACVKTIQTETIHPTINLDDPDPLCDLDYVPHQARPGDVRTALKISCAMGGHNACLVFRRFEGSGSRSGRSGV